MTPSVGPVVGVDPAIASIVRPAVASFDQVRVVDRTPALAEALAAAAEAVRTADPAATAARVSAVRTMYKGVGLDPTRTRPSSEGLLRRLRRGDPLPQVNTLVDVINWCSVQLQLPYGLYDRASIDGDVLLRLGRAGEEYAGIRKDVVHLAGRLTLADARGPFGNPTSDSARTSVSVRTTAALVVIFVPAPLGADVDEQALALTRRRVAEFCSP